MNLPPAAVATIIDTETSVVLGSIPSTPPAWRPVNPKEPTQFNIGKFSTATEIFQRKTFRLSSRYFPNSWALIVSV